MVVSYYKALSHIDGMKQPIQPTLPKDVKAELPPGTEDAIVNQDIGTLEDYRKWIDALIAYKRHLLVEDDPPSVTVTETTGGEVLTTIADDERSDVETRDLLGTFAWQFLACGNERCVCTNGSPDDLHGPYLRRQYLDGSGHRMTEYVPENDRRQELVRRVAAKPAPGDLEESARE